ncbi:MAG: polyprenyl synthetase family protein [Halothiobacillaceae bacterium]
MKLDQIRTLAADDMQTVNEVITQRLASDVALVNQLSAYIIGAGGKRFRPMITVLAARAVGDRSGWAPQMAAVIEFIHTATLLHDDVVDNSTLRRGRDTANVRFGNSAAVLVGDFLYSRAFEMMVEPREMAIMALLARTTNVIAEGEVMQLMNCGDADTDEARYMSVIHCKTAKLFEAAAQIGAILAHSDEKTQAAMGRYGMHLGTAFQLMDDVLDYDGDEDMTGKHLGDDLAEGKPTLPLIIAMQRGNADESRLIRAAIEGQHGEHMQEIHRIVARTGALDYTAALAKSEATRACDALAVLPDTPWREALGALAQLSADRAS